MRLKVINSLRLFFFPEKLRFTCVTSKEGMGGSYCSVFRSYLCLGSSLPSSLVPVGTEFPFFVG